MKKNSETGIIETTFKCTGKAIADELKFIHNHPFIQFELASDLSMKITDLNIIPRIITVYDIKYFLGGCTMHVGLHYFAYVYHEESKLFYKYDGLGSTFTLAKSTLISPSRENISLLIYFMCDNKLLSVIEEPTFNSQNLSKSENCGNTPSSKVRYDFRKIPRPKKYDTEFSASTPCDAHFDTTCDDNTCDAMIVELLQIKR